MAKINHLLPRYSPALSMPKSASRHKFLGSCLGNCLGDREGTGVRYSTYSTLVVVPEGPSVTLVPLYLGTSRSLVSTMLHSLQ